MHHHKTVREYLEWIQSEHTTTFEDIVWPLKLTYYRGHANKEWEIKPSLFRNNYLYYEHKLLTTSENVLWKELQDTKSYLEKLIILQHYGLPTRLLDVTTNPLVALYFACQECKDENGNDVDGVVYGSHNSLINNHEVEDICKVLFHREIPAIFENLDNIGLTNNEKFKTITTNTYYIAPPLNNERIISQNGAFLMPPLLEKQGKIYVLNQQEVNKEDVFPIQFIVPKERKSSIRNELMNYGFHEGSLFPDIEHKLQYAKRLVDLQISHI